MLIWPVVGISWMVISGADGSLGTHMLSATNTETDSQTDKQTDKQTHRLRNRHTHKTQWHRHKWRQNIAKKHIGKSALSVKACYRKLFKVVGHLVTFKFNKIVFQGDIIYAQPLTVLHSSCPDFIGPQLGIQSSRNLVNPPLWQNSLIYHTS